MSKSVPKRRFKGFEDNWEQRELKYVAEYIRGSFPQPYTNKDFYDEMNGKPFVQVADIGFDLRLNQDTKQHISKLAEPKSRFVEAGKVVVALQGSIETSIGRTAITQYDAYFDRTILIFEKYKVPIDKIYFAQVIKELFAKEKEKAWGATISTITKDYLNDFVICVPNVEEQQKIGEFLQFLDNLSNLYQQKYDKLQALKKAYLYEMFPQEGESVPKRRFAGFSGDWEWIKLSDIANKVSEKNVINQYSETLTNSAEYGIIRQRDYFDKNISNKENLSGYYIVQPDDFVYNPRISVNAPVGPINRNKLNRTGIVSPLYTVFRTHNIIPEYLEYYFKNSIWYGYMYFYGDTGARADRFSIRDDVFMNMPICCPVNEEQTKIAKFFETFDKSISEINSKLQKLKALKQAYLAEMFV